MAIPLLGALTDLLSEQRRIFLLKQREGMTDEEISPAPRRFGGDEQKGAVSFGQRAAQVSGHQDRRGTLS